MFYTAAAMKLINFHNMISKLSSQQICTFGISLNGMHAVLNWKADGRAGQAAAAAVVAKLNGCLRGISHLGVYSNYDYPIGMADIAEPVNHIVIAGILNKNHIHCDHFRMS